MINGDVLNKAHGTLEEFAINMPIVNNSHHYETQGTNGVWNTSNHKYAFPKHNLKAVELNHAPRTSSKMNTFLSPKFCVIVSRRMYKYNHNVAPVHSSIKVKPPLDAL